MTQQSARQSLARRGGALILGAAVALSLVVPATLAQAATIERQATLDEVGITVEFQHPGESVVIGPDTETITFTLPSLMGEVVGPEQLYWSIMGSDDIEFVVEPTPVNRVGSTVTVTLDADVILETPIPPQGDVYDFFLSSYELGVPMNKYLGVGDGDDSRVRVSVPIVPDEDASSPTISITVDAINASDYSESYVFAVDPTALAAGDTLRIASPGAFNWRDGINPDFMDELWRDAYFVWEEFGFAELPPSNLTVVDDIASVTIPSSLSSALLTATNPELYVSFYHSNEEVENAGANMVIVVPVEFEAAPAKWKKVGTPTVSGAKVGGVATVKTGSWSPAPTSFEYQWMLDGVEIVDANDATYEPEVADFGKSLSVKVTAKRAGYADQLRVSKAVKVAAGTFTAATPTLSGDTQVGDTLTVDEGVWDPAAEFAYTWLRSGKTIKGATGDSYTLTSADRGKTIQVKVTGSAEGYKSASKTSAKTAKVGYGTLEGGTLSLTGDGIVEATLTASLTGVNPVPSKVTYQWYVNGKAIKGATKADFVVPGSALFGHITVEAKASLAGYTTKQFVVNPGKLNIAPASLTTVTVDLPDEVVAGKTVKAAVSGQGKGATVSYQWFFDGNPIPGATKSSYKPAAADWGKTLRVAVAVAKPGYLGTYGQHTAGSVLLTYKAPKPKIVYTGTLTAGTELSVNAGTWNPEPIVAEQYQWLVGKTVVGTSPTYTVQPADKGKKITVKVTVPADSGYAALTVTSKATGKVK